MRKTWILAVLTGALILPSVRLLADEGKYEADEKTESREKQQAEEREAMEIYQKKVAKFGNDSAQAKKAWKHVVSEYKEHGDTPPTPDSATSTPKS